MSWKPFACLLLVSFLSAESRGADGPVPYRLEPGSTFLDDCPICGRPPIVLPLEGTFVLKLKAIGDVTDWYEIDSIDFRAAVPGGQKNIVSGSGSYLTRVGAGGIVATHSMSLDVEINGEAGLKLESGEVKAVTGLPAIDIEVQEATASQVRVYKLHLIAIPADAVMTSASGSLLLCRAALLRSVRPWMRFSRPMCAKHWLATKSPPANAMSVRTGHFAARANGSSCLSLHWSWTINSFCAMNRFVAARVSRTWSSRSSAQAGKLFTCAQGTRTGSRPRSTRVS